MSITDAVDALNVIEQFNEDRQRQEIKEKAVSFGRTMKEFTQSEVWTGYLKPLLDKRLSEAQAEMMDVKKGDTEWPNNLVRAQEKALSCKYLIGIIEAPIVNMKRILKEEDDE